MLDFAKKYYNDITSQNGENGIIEECIKRIKPELKVAVEFGAPDEKYCSNIFPLGNAGFALIYYDDSTQSPYVEKKYIDPDNVNDIQECSVLSIDIDGNDFNVWKAYKGKPAIVVIEINSSLDPDVEFFHPDRGSSFCTMNRLANDKGYFLLCHTGNCIYVDLKYHHLFPEIDFIVTSEKFFNNSWLQVLA